ncbi:MAG: glycosyltransferase family 2 protein [Aggregatilineales bacterium]
MADRLVRWLRGERRHIVSADMQDRPEWHGYEAYCRLTALREADLEAQREEALTWHKPPVFGLITPVYQPPLHFFRRTVESVLRQSCPHWRWYLADATPTGEIWQYLTLLAGKDERIVPIRLAENGGISANSNVALRHAHAEGLCDYIVLLDHDDMLAPQALYTVSRFLQEHPDADLIYSDEDKINDVDHRYNPFFKPDWSPEMMLCVNCVCHMSVIRRSLLERVGEFDPRKDGAQDWDLFLRISEMTDKIYHIPKVLYHWRAWEGSIARTIAAKDWAAKAQLAAIREHLERTGIYRPHVFFDPQHPIHAAHPLVTWDQRQPRRIAIIIPSRDKAEVLRGCLASLFERTCYPYYRVIVVDTGSTEQATFELYERYKGDERFQVLNYAGPFNFSRACNLGAQHATDADLLLFMNNDMEVLDGQWLARMAQWFERKGVGIVGAKLIYPNGTIQHGGVYVGGGGLASHLFGLQADNSDSIFGSVSWYRNLLAVTGACLLISREAFDKVGGFDENYQLNYSDVALCLRVHEAGYRIVYTPHACLIHYESVTHGRRIPRSDFLRANQEFQKWIQAGDPYYNPNLSYAMLDVTLSPAHRPVALNRRVMARLPNKPLIKLPDDLM